MGAKSETNVGAKLKHRQEPVNLESRIRVRHPLLSLKYEQHPKIHSARNSEMDGYSDDI